MQLRSVDEIEWRGPLHIDDLIEYFGLDVRLHESDHSGYIDGTLHQEEVG